MPIRSIPFVRGKNIATENRASRYIVDPIEMLHVDDDARTKGMDLIGIYHSDPNHPAVPSEFDRSRAAPWYTYVILSIVDREPQGSRLGASTSPRNGSNGKRWFDCRRRPIPGNGAGQRSVNLVQIGFLGSHSVGRLPCLLTVIRRWISAGRTLSMTPYWQKGPWRTC